MKLAFIGNFVPSYSTENDIVWSLQQLGHDVKLFQENDSTTDDILEACQDFDAKLLIYVHTHGWITPGSFDFDELLRRLDEVGIVTASFHLDYWYGLARQGDVGQHPFWRTKYVFTADGGSHEWYVEQGINHFWLQPGVVERDCYWAEPKEEFIHDVIFVGSKAYHPEWSYRPELLDWLSNTYGDRFAHYGNDGIRVIRGPDLNRLYRTAKVVVGDSLCLDFKHRDYWSDRVPETMGRGGFLIHPFIEGLQDSFIEQEHIVYYNYGDFGQLKDLIDYYLENYIEREEIRLDGHAEVKLFHTYTNRMREMLDIISGEEGWRDNTDT